MTADAPVPVRAERHSGRYWKRFASYTFARDRAKVALALAEVEQAAAMAPVVFARERGGIHPFVLLRIGAGAATPFIGPDGAWRGKYIPSALRAHPFAAAELGDGKLALLVDETSGLVTDDPADTAFFDAAGAPSAELNEVVEFFRSRSGSARAAAAAGRALAEAKLLAPLAAVAELPDGAGAEGLFGVDRAALGRLDDAAVLALHRNGALALAQSHAVSLQHAIWLHRLESAGSAPAEAPPADTSLSGFLDALARSRENDDAT